MPKNVSAAVLVIGNEILSGRTKDVNISFLGEALNEIGIRLEEARIVSDVEADIVAAVNALRARYDYVFTTGGIGPTHDDITADSVAAAFGVDIGYHSEVYELLKQSFESRGVEVNEARMRMARVPSGATLIDNEVSLAPGFQLENVFVSRRGAADRAQYVRSGQRAVCLAARQCAHAASGCTRGEGTIAQPLAALQALYPGRGYG